jgi:hypothetical protein
VIAAVKEHYGEKGASGTAGMLWRFANEIVPGDLVLTPDPETRELHVGTVTGEYEFRSNPPVEGYPNVRPVDWSRRFSRDDLPKRILYQLGSLLTVSQPSAQAELRAFLAGTSLDGTGEAAIEASTEDDPTGGVDLYEELRSQTGELVRAKIADLDAYQTQDLFAGILRSMGYFTQVAPEGKDGGVDIVASRDALGVEPPIVKVQVKGRLPADLVRVGSGSWRVYSDRKTSEAASSQLAATPGTPRTTPRSPGSSCRATPRELGEARSRHQEPRAAPARLCPVGNTAFSAHCATRWSIRVLYSQTS